jgi:autotransporter-associated beta strand protein
MNPTRKLSILFGILLSIQLAAPSLFAAPRTWVGSASANWSAANGFDGVPVNNDTLTFNAAGAAGTTLNNDLAAGLVFPAITYGAAASAYTNGGSAFTLGTSTAGTALTIMSGSGAQIINDNLTLGNNTQTFSLANNLTLGGTVSTGGSACALTLAGAGALTVKNTFNLGTGTSDILTIPNTVGSSFVLGSGVTVTVGKVTGGGSGGGSINLGASSTLNDQGGGNTALDARLLGAGTFIVNSVQYFYQTYTAPDNSGFSGVFEVTGGDNRFGKGAAGLGSGTLLLSSSGGVDSSGIYINGTGNFINKINVVGNGGYIRANTGTTTISGDVTGSGTLVLLPSTCPVTGNWTSGNAFGSAFAGTVYLGYAGGSQNVTITANINSANSSSASAAYVFNAPSTLQANITGGGTVNLGSLASTASAILQNAVSSSTATFSIGGANTSTTFGGVIQNGTGTAALTKVGTGILTLTNIQTYTGATTVRNGTLAITNGILAAGSAVSVTAADGNANLAGSGTVNGSVTLSASGSFNAGVNLQNNAVGTLTLAGGLTLNSGNVLSFDVGSASDSIAVSGTYTPPGSGTVTVNIANISGFTPGTYNLITGASGIGAGSFTLGTTPPTGYVYNLQVSGSSLQIVVSLSAPVTAWWKGDQDGNWNTTSPNYNWDTDQTSGIDTGGIPSTPTAVHFSANGAAHFSTTLGQDFTINSLTFDTASSVTIAGGNTLTVNGGITNSSSAGNNIISATTLALGLDQTWANNSANPLTVSSAINGGKALTIAGSGTITLSGGITGGGNLIKNDAGVLDLGATTGSSVGAVTVSSGTIQNGTLTGTSYALQSGTVSTALSGTGVAVNKTTGGSATLSGNNSYSGGTTVSAGTLILSGNNSGTAMAVTNNATLQLQAVAGNTSAGISSAIGSSSTLTLNNASTVQLRGDSNVTFTPASIANLPSDPTGSADTTSFNFDVNNLTSATAKTLTLNAALNFSQVTGNRGSDITTINVTGGNGYFLGLGAVTLSINGDGGKQAIFDIAAGLGLKIPSISDSGQSQNVKFQDSGSVSVGDFVQANGRTDNINISGPGTVTITGNAQHTGTTGTATNNFNLNGGQLNINSSKALRGDNAGGAFNANLTIAGGNLDNTAGTNITLANPVAQIWNADFTFLGSTNLNLSSGAVTLGASRQVTVNANTLTVGGVISDSGSGFALTKTGNGTLTLAGASTYSGNTIISSGTLALSGSGSIAATPLISVADGAVLDVSGLSSTFALGSGQTLSNNAVSTGTLNGNLNTGNGTVSIAFLTGTPSFTVTNGTLTLSNLTTFLVNNTGAALTAGSYKIISKATAGNVGAVAGTLPPVTVSGGGTAAETVASLQIVSGELYLGVTHPPKATTMTVTRAAGLSVKISLSDLATNWSDADGDTVVLSGINLVTTNSINLATNSAWILYTNSPNVNDQFSYSISDGNGGTNIGLVNIVITSNLTGQATGLFNNPGGPVTVSFAGIPGYSYSVQRTTNLTDWVTIWTTNAPGGGLFNYTDSFVDLGGTPPTSAYYRLGWIPSP